VLLPLDQVLRIVKDAFTSATERDIYTGDYLEIWVITAQGVTMEKMDLKKD
jgi:20S proteasome subunit beta 6